MTYTIEKNIPVPNKMTRSKKSPFRQILDVMEKGDSVIVTDMKRNNLYAMLNAVKKETRKKFTCRTEGEGMRVWRTA